MKTLLLSLAALFLTSVSKAEDQPYPSYLLIAPQGMDTALVSRVQVWMATNLHYEVHLKVLPSWDGSNALEQAESLAALPGPQDLVTVVLANRLDEGKHAVLVPGEAMGFINVPLLATDPFETYARRLERQAIRIVGYILGVPPQPMPFCALAPYNDLQELDRIGRGFSPPAMATYRSNLEELGLPLTPAGKRLLPAVKINMPVMPTMPVMPVPVPPSPVPQTQEK